MLVLLLPLLTFALASVSVYDAGDYYNISADTADNALISNYSVAASTYFPELNGVYHLIDDDLLLNHTQLSVNENDTSIIVADNSNVTLDYVELFKQGYSSNLNDASFYGVNSVINIQNGSQADLSSLNITSHNGAAGVYAYGTGTTVYITDSSLYFSGPVAHGLYASGNGTIYGDGLIHYAGGERLSAFSGDKPAGYIHVSNSVAHTTGIGSAIFYVLGEVHASDVVGEAESAPFLFSDGPQKAYISHSQLTAGLLGGTVIFSSSTREFGAEQTFTDSTLAVKGNTVPALWYGNIGATTYLNSVRIKTDSGILAVANFSQVTQDFDYYASYEDNTDLAPAEVEIYITESSIEGDLVAYNQSSIELYVSDHSVWLGSAYHGSNLGAFVSVTLDSSSVWSLSSNATLDYLSVANISSVESNGFLIFFNLSNTLNDWIENDVQLSGGGSLIPY